MSKRSVIQAIKAFAATVVVVLMLSVPAFSQPVARFSNNYFCEFTSVKAPLLVTGFDEITSITMYITFDDLALEFVDLTDLNPGMNSGNTIWNFSENGNESPLIIFTWVKTGSPLTIEEGTLFNLQFNYSEGEAFIGFSDDCEISVELSPSDDAIFKNGTVAPIEIISQPADQLAAVNTNALFSVTLNGVGNYHWQHNAGTGWEDLADDDLFSGALTNQLIISIANKDFDNHQFRCLVQVDECDFTSDEAILTVSLLSIDERNSGYHTLMVYPNPCSNVLSYSTSEALGAHSIELVNSMGTVVFQSYSRQPSEFRTGTIPLDGMPSGIYILQLMDDNHRLMNIAKVIKQ